jgi:hypothetical protein
MVTVSAAVGGPATGPPAAQDVVDQIFAAFQLVPAKAPPVRAKYDAAPALPAASNAAISAIECNQRFMCI